MSKVLGQNIVVENVGGAWTLSQSTICLDEGIRADRPHFAPAGGEKIADAEHRDAVKPLFT
jgi:hypothetical protein